ACPVLDCYFPFVANDILTNESFSEEFLRENLGRVKFFLELFLIVSSAVKFGRRIQTAEVRMTANMVPVCVSDEHGCERRQSRRIVLQCFVCTFCKIRARASVDADEFVPVAGNNEVVFREFEAGQRVDATGNDLGNSSRRKRMTCSSRFGKRGCKGDRVIEI